MKPSAAPAAVPTPSAPAAGEGSVAAKGSTKEGSEASKGAVPSTAALPEAASSASGGEQRTAVALEGEKKIAGLAAGEGPSAEIHAADTTKVA